MPRQLRVFLCHASQDKPAVWKLHRYLTEHGISPWLDQNELLPGQSWQMEIPKAIDNSDVILVCLSKNSINKEGYVQKEIAFALDKALEKPEGTIFIIPLKLEECEVPKRLSPYQWVDYFRPEGRSRLLKSLYLRVKDLGNDVSIISPAQTDASPKPVLATQNLRWLGISGVLIMTLLFGNYLFQSKGYFQTETLYPSLTFSVSETVVPTHTPTPTSPTITPTPGVGSTYISYGVVMMYVPKGSFSMGSQDGNNDEKPIHAILLNSYYFDKYEVTNISYKRCVEAGVCKPPAPSSSNTHSAYYSNPEFDEFPVIYINWDMAKTYCEWRGARLPTEAEWEKAAKGTDGRTYPWGEGFDCARANFNGGNCIGDTTKVGSYQNGVSPYGVNDMAGNVWEWVSDFYSTNYYQASPPFNPLGPDSGNLRIFRGGSWNDVSTAIRSSYRYAAPDIIQYNNVGIRCAMDATP